MIVLFQTTMMALTERIQKLEDQLAKNNRSSGKPPSSDGYAYGARARTVCVSDPGAKAEVRGHPGETLKAVEKPTDIQVHHVRACQHCGQSLQRRKALGHEKRQVFDLPKVQLRRMCPF